MPCKHRTEASVSNIGRNEDSTISHQLHQQSSILTKLLQGQYLSHRRESPKFALYWGGTWTHELWKSVVDGALRRDCSKTQVLIRTLNEFIFA